MQVIANTMKLDCTRECAVSSQYSLIGNMQRVATGGVNTNEHEPQQKNAVSAASHSSVIQQGRQTGGRAGTLRLNGCITSKGSEIIKQNWVRTVLLSWAPSIIHDNGGLIRRASISEGRFYKPGMMSNTIRQPSGAVKSKFPMNTTFFKTVNLSKMSKHSFFKKNPHALHNRVLKLVLFCKPDADVSEDID